MAGLNPQLVLGPSLQMYFVDKDTGLPLAGGQVYFWEDNARNVPKDVYTISGTPPNYVYTALPNPVTLSAVGTIQDGSGNDVLPYYYPFVGTPDDPSTTPDLYFIQVFDSSGVEQFIREGWPNTTSGSIPGITIDSLDNYIVNNVFYDNIINGASASTLDVSMQTALVIAPGVHNGFSMPDIQFVKSNTAATDTLSFPSISPPFSQAAIPYPEPTPEVACRLQCTGAGVGETYKAIQFPISLHIETLSQQTGTLTFWAKAGAVSANNKIQPYIYQFAGTGAAIQAVPIPQGSPISLTAGWAKYFVPITFPDSSAITVSSTGDDALYLQLGLPLALTCDIYVTKPCVYLGTSVPTNEFDTYDHINSIVNSPRTGDMRETMNAFGAPSLTQALGWVALDDGTIGNPSSNATTRANTDTWPLFNLFWQNFKNNGMQVFAPMFTSAASPTSYGASAYADWAANNQLQLGFFEQRNLIGTPTAITGTFTSSSNTLTLTFTNGYTAGYLYPGNAVLITNISGTTTLTAGLYWITNYNFGSGTIELANSYPNAISGTNITFTGTPTGNVTFSPLGSAIGAQDHTLLQAELPNVTLPLAGVNLYKPWSSGGANGSFSSGDNASAEGTSSSQSGVVSLGGSGHPFNILTQTTMVNRYIKL
jgi:hypothetical protein